jgi:enterochelin esterase-like enzyme
MFALPLSPRLRTLQLALQQGVTDALSDFWQAITRQGTPLLEPIPDDSRASLVTFLWRATEPVHNVVVVGWLVPFDVTQNQMTWLLNTDLWYITYRMPKTLRATYFLSPNDSLKPYQEEDDWEARHANWRADPLNPHVFVTPRDEDNPESHEMVWSILELPAAPAQPWLLPQQDRPAGTVTRHDFHSTLLANDRRIWIYTPPGYPDSAASYRLLLLLDGWMYLHMLQTPLTLDNLLAAGSIPPLVTVFIDSPDRNAEFTCVAPFVDFLMQELLPWIHAHHQVTRDPQQTVIGGASFGGLAALHAGIERPNCFGGVLSQSGAFWWSPAGDSEHEWLLRQIQMLERVVQRVYLEAGTLETVAGQGVPSLEDTNRRMRDCLQAKGATVNYAEFTGGHEFICWRGSLADGLYALLNANDNGGSFNGQPVVAG